MYFREKSATFLDLAFVPTVTMPLKDFPIVVAASFEVFINSILALAVQCHHNKIHHGRMLMV